MEGIAATGVKAGKLIIYFYYSICFLSFYSWIFYFYYLFVIFDVFVYLFYFYLFINFVLYTFNFCVSFYLFAILPFFILFLDICIELSSFQPSIFFPMKYEIIICTFSNILVICNGSISEMAMHFLDKFGLMVIKIMSKFELRRMCGALEIGRASCRERVSSPV